MNNKLPNHDPHHGRHRIVTPEEFRHRGLAWFVLGVLTSLVAGIVYGAVPGPGGQVCAVVLVILGVLKFGWGVHLWNRGAK